MSNKKQYTEESPEILELRKTKDAADNIGRLTIFLSIMSFLVGASIRHAEMSTYLLLLGVCLAVFGSVCMVVMFAIGSDISKKLHLSGVAHFERMPRKGK